MPKKKKPDPNNVWDWIDRPLGQTPPRAEPQVALPPGHDDVSAPLDPIANSAEVEDPS